MGLRVSNSLSYRSQGPRKMWVRRKTQLKQCFRKIQRAAMCRLDSRG